MRKLLLATLLLLSSFIVRAQVPEFELSRTFGAFIDNPYDIEVDYKNFMYVLESHKINKLDPAGNLVKSFNVSVKERAGTAVSLTLDKAGNMYVLDIGFSVVQKFNPQGELLMKFGDYGNERGQFQVPQSLDVDEAGNIYVADKGNDRIQKFTPQGEFIYEFKLPSEPYNIENNPIAIKVGKSGIIYFLTEDYRIFKLNEEGKLIEKFEISIAGYTASKNPENSLALDEEENIYISNLLEFKIHKLNSFGKHLQSFGTDDLSTGSLDNIKNAITVNLSGDLYVAERTKYGNGSILIFNSAGILKKEVGNQFYCHDIVQDYQDNFYLLSANSKNFIRKFNSIGQLINQVGTYGQGDGQFQGPKALAVDLSDNLYVLESTSGFASIQKFNKEGKFLAKYKDFGNDVSYNVFWDLAVDTQGNMYVTDFYGGCVRKLSSTGKFIKKISSPGTKKGQVYIPKALTVDEKGNVYVADYNGHRIQKFNSDGRFILEMSSATFSGDSVNVFPASIAVDFSGNVFSWNGFGGFIQRFDATGKEVAKMEGIQGYISMNRDGTKMLLAYSSLVWEYLTSSDHPKQSLITGNVYQDINKNCQRDATEKPLSGIVVTAEPGPYYGVSDEQGNYSIPVDTGRYTIKTILPQDVGRTITPTCPAASSKIIHVPGYGTIATGPDFGNQVSTAPVLNVEVASNRRRRCFRNTTTVSYANTGFATAQNAKVMVQLPDFVHFISANAAYTRDNKGNYLFAIGTLQPNQRGTITIIDSVSCHDPSIRGLTVCTKAWITPANMYTTPSHWNKAEISVSGKMTPEGQARFVLHNKGQGDMTDSLAFRVFQDVDLVLKSKYKLATGDSLVLRFTPTSRVVRVEVDQPAGHPLKATASANLEVKSKNAARAPAPLMMAYPPDDPEPEIAEDCQPILDSFDPNDKQVIPVGLTTNHYTPTNTPLRYTIRFQNTGNDVAYRVVVVDTLAADLDLSTLQMGAASHAYTLNISGKAQPVLTFTFDNIMLPDSTHNPAGSNGFISFNVKPKANLPEKAEIKNYADIFFDYNEPVRTNTTVNRIYDVPPVLNINKQLSAQTIITTPTISSFLPAQSRAGEEVTILGCNFASSITDNLITFNGVKATIISASAERLTVRVPEKAFSGKIKITTPDGAALSPTDFLIFQRPILTDLSVTEGVPGQVITLTGNYFSLEAAMDTVLFNGVLAKVLEASETHLQVVVPAAGTRSKILIKTRGGQVEGAQEFRIWYPPVITSFNPGKGKAHKILTLEGSHFAEEPSRNKVQFAGIPGQVLASTATVLRIKVPADAISGLIQIETPGGVTHSPTDFTFIPAPVITSFTPISGNAGTGITIMGKNFNADSQADTVLINDFPAKILKSSETMLEIQAPKGVRTGTLTVAGAGGRTSSSEFLVLDLTPKEALIIYPNPAREIIRIDWHKADFTVEKLEVYNAVGKRVLTENLKNSPNDERQLSLQALPAGVYTFRVQTSVGVIVKQIIRL